ncbi:curli-like amyloid fiber formation chaperone CsgH [Devosia riboflavina]|uniref:curli-like amyloid fiber formation chaperone CsgH n=1 Tax=Devosia riboflavina TaxID=46914 RepID=UPI0005562C5A|nr:curli-like amyloid fiber formation chaperone CsgH [Devosia riboflavina]
MLHPFIQTTIAAAAAIAAVGFAANANAAGGDFACGVISKTQGGMLALEGTLVSPTALTGEYRFALKSAGGGGSTNISQGGQFSAAPNAEISLGQVMINANSNVSVDFTVTANGKTFDCSQTATRT